MLRDVNNINIIQSEIGGTVSLEIQYFDKESKEK